MTAGLIARLLKQEPQAPSDRALSLSSPSPAQWAADQVAACKALTALNWHCVHGGTGLRTELGAQLAVSVFLLSYVHSSGLSPLTSWAYTTDG